MFNLLYKELRLAAHPTLYVFMLMGALIIIPSYPYSVVFLFGCLAPFITFLFGRETRDTYYTALLPVRKSDVVKGKCLMIVFAQIGELLFSIPFAILHAYLFPGKNIVGMEPNVTYYGFGFLCFALFNLVFLTQFYRTAYKVGKSFILAMIPVTVVMVGMETISHIPSLKWLDRTETDMLIRQIPILAAGIFLYLFGTIAAYHLAVDHFDKVDL